MLPRKDCTSSFLKTSLTRPFPFLKARNPSGLRVRVKGKVGWKKKELSGLINVQEKLFLEVLSEIAHFDKSKQLWVLKEGNVHT